MNHLQSEPFFEKGSVVFKNHGNDYHFLTLTIRPLYFEDLEAASKCISKIVKHEVDPIVESIILALDDYLEENESDDIWYSFHKIQEIDD